MTINNNEMFKTRGPLTQSTNELMIENLYLAHENFHTKPACNSQRQIRTAYACGLSQAETAKRHDRISFLSILNKNTVTPQFVSRFGLVVRR